MIPIETETMTFRQAWVMSVSNEVIGIFLGVNSCQCWKCWLNDIVYIRMQLSNLTIISRHHTAMVHDFLLSCFFLIQNLPSTIMYGIYTGLYWPMSVTRCCGPKYVLDCFSLLLVGEVSAIMSLHKVISRYPQVFIHLSVSCPNTGDLGLAFT